MTWVPAVLFLWALSVIGAYLAGTGALDHPTDVAARRDARAAARALRTLNRWS